MRHERGWQEKIAARTARRLQANTERQDSQHVLKAEPAMADATDSEIPANMSPRGGAMGVGQAAAAAPAAITTAAADVLAERQRQIEAEGWTAEHDDSHDGCELAAAAACYAVCADSRQVGRLNYDGAPLWPGRWLFKPKTYRANLVRAAALLLAEIERLDRVATAPR